MNEKVHGYSFWRSLGSPWYIASPMVDQSELAFRILCARYGAQLCFTPMLHAKNFIADSTYRRQRFDVCEKDAVPVIVQFAGDDPEIMLRASRFVESSPRVVAVDINCGCPQPIARKGHYGSALLREADVICEMVRKLHEELTIPVTAKIRILDEGGNDPSLRGLQGTLRLVEQIVAAGASVITVHGRNRLMSGKKTGSADWQSIAAVKRRVSIPVIANGNIESFDDIEKCLLSTGADAVMSAEALLENPALFNRNNNHNSYNNNSSNSSSRTSFYVTNPPRRPSPLLSSSSSSITAAASAAATASAVARSSTSDMNNGNDICIHTTTNKENDDEDCEMDDDGRRTRIISQESLLVAASSTGDASAAPAVTAATSTATTTATTTTAAAAAFTSSNRNGVVILARHLQPTTRNITSPPSPFQLSREYLNIVNSLPQDQHPYDFNKCAKAHLLRMLHLPLTVVSKYHHHLTAAHVHTHGYPPHIQYLVHSGEGYYGGDSNQNKVLIWDAQRSSGVHTAEEVSQLGSSTQHDHNTTTAVDSDDDNGGYDSDMRYHKMFAVATDISQLMNAVNNLETAFLTTTNYMTSCCCGGGGGGYHGATTTLTAATVDDTSASTSATTAATPATTMVTTTSSTNTDVLSSIAAVTPATSDADATTSVATGTTAAVALGNSSCSNTTTDNGFVLPWLHDWLITHVQQEEQQQQQQQRDEEEEEDQSTASAPGAAAAAAAAAAGDTDDDCGTISISSSQLLARLPENNKRQNKKNTNIDSYTDDDHQHQQQQQEDQMGSSGRLIVDTENNHSSCSSSLPAQSSQSSSSASTSTAVTAVTALATAAATAADTWYRSFISPEDTWYRRHPRKDKTTPGAAVLANNNNTNTSVGRSKAARDRDNTAAACRGGGSNQHNIRNINTDDDDDVTCTDTRTPNNASTDGTTDTIIMPTSTSGIIRHNLVNDAEEQRSKRKAVNRFWIESGLRFNR